MIRVVAKKVAAGRGRNGKQRTTSWSSARVTRARARAETRDRFYLFVCLFSVATVTRRSILACLKNGYTSNLTHLTLRQCDMHHFHLSRRAESRRTTSAPSSTLLYNSMTTHTTAPITVDPPTRECLYLLTRQAQTFTVSALMRDVSAATR